MQIDISHSVSLDANALAASIAAAPSDEVGALLCAIFRNMAAREDHIVASAKAFAAADRSFNSTNSALRLFVSTVEIASRAVV